MTDQELLTLAAKAAGINADWDGDGFVVPKPFKGYTNYDAWNPLTDDGDAFRLAVKLRMNIVVSTVGPSARAEDEKWIDENCAAGDDYNAATRRAIVRAAAAIGKGAV